MNKNEWKHEYGYLDKYELLSREINNVIDFKIHTILQNCPELTIERVDKIHGENGVVTAYELGYQFQISTTYDISTGFTNGVSASYLGNASRYLIDGYMATQSFIRHILYTYDIRVTD